MLKIFKNKRKLKYIILSILIIIVLLSTITLTIVNNLSKDDSNSVQIAKANETYSSTNPYIPKGFTHSEGSITTGYVIKETATGNEFVWIPVDSSNTLIRREFTKTFSSMASASDPENTSFSASVLKFGGYYVGRYEAGIGSTNGNTIGIPVCKKGATVWRNISRNNAASSAQEMYKKSEELISSLMNSYAYDTMLNWLKIQNYNVDNDSSSWGNYKNSSDGNIKSAGTSNKKAYNIYDIAGNVWEWTTENYGNDAVVRGGDAFSSGVVLPAGTRDHASPTSAFDYTGFRVLLYRKYDFVEKATALAIAGGINSTAYLDSNNILWMWGKNDKGQLGNGNTNSPIIKPTPINTSINFKEISLSSQNARSGNGFTIGIDTAGYLYTWGYNGNGQLGNGKSGTGTSYYVLTPQKINVTNTNGSTVQFKKISAGRTHCLAIDKSGNIWAWGNNLNYQTGLSKNSGNTTTPTQITSGITFSEIATAASHNIALAESGQLYTWGDGANYKLGTTSQDDIKTPSLLNTGSTRFKKISAGTSNSFAIDTTGRIWACGYNGNGLIGNGSTSSLRGFQKLTNITRQFKDISSNYENTIAIDTEDHLWGWGSNTNGQLGNGSSGSNAKEPIEILAGIKNKKIAIGTQFFIAVAENEDVYTCGTNSYGQLGNNSTDDKHVPVKITIGN